MDNEEYVTILHMLEVCDRLPRADINGLESIRMIKLLNGTKRKIKQMKIFTLFYLFYS